MNELPLNQVLCGDCREVMKNFSDDCIDLVVTSPPYWGLRDYGGISSILWGGKNECNHVWDIENIVKKSTYNENFNERWGNSPGQRKQEVKSYLEYQCKTCINCGAWYGQLGLEPHPQMYIDHIVSISKEIMRILKPNGSFWINLGDTYYGSGGKGGQYEKFMPEKGQPKHYRQKSSIRNNWLQPKQLLGIPWRVAIALQNEGWILRNCIIWYKRNHMPESVKDRLTKSYEFFFFFVKSRKYYFDLDSIREKYSDVSIARLTQPSIMNQMGGPKQHELYGDAPGHGNRPAEILKGLAKKYGGKYNEDIAETLSSPRARQATRDTTSYYHSKGKNPGDLWDIPTTPFPGAHFAVFPVKLIEPIIKAGCTENGVVLDPFCGSGTALKVARRLGHKFIGIDINQEYCDIAHQRIRGQYKPLPDGVKPFDIKGVIS